MIWVSPARSAEDFAVAARLCRGLADWDAVAVQPYGVSAEDVVAIFHPEIDANALTAKFGVADASFLIARWDEAPAGSIAFDPFDDDTVEIHKFFVGPQFRGKGIGRALMGSALAEIGKGNRREVVLHTTPYMESAVAIYGSFGFQPCPRFRDTPEHVKHTDMFMSRSLTA